MGRKFYLTNFNFAAANTYNAGTKAVSDVDTILQAEGYAPLYFGYGGKRGYLQKRFLFLYCILSMLFKLRRDDTLFIQYPFYNIDAKDWFRTKRIFKCIGCKIYILIHDLNSLRYSGTSEDELLFTANRVICHTPRMSELLQSMGVEKERIKILYLFDYLTDSTNKHATTFGKDIIFAGNLAKSTFIANLTLIPNLQFLLYGLPPIESKDNVRYMGKFSPNDISDIQGDWGLVWDGDSIESCNNLIGKYLSINSSHKISLYIVAHKPLIVWDGSSLKDFIVKNNLGIVVKSLDEIGPKIEQLSESEKQLMRTSLSYFARVLKHGEQLKAMLSE